MRLGIVSDTHGHLENTRRAVRILEQLEVAEVLHCGDIGDPRVISLFAPWPARYVWGNVDRAVDELAAAVAGQGQHCCGLFGSFELQGRRIALLHGHQEAVLETTIESGSWDLVCHGHTHRTRCERIGRTLVVNPGALFRARRHTFAIAELPSLEVEHIGI